MKDKLMTIKSNMKPWHWWVILIILFSIVGGMTVWNMQKENYKTLYSGLTAEDSKAIERYLSQSGISYKKDESGENISVPVESVSSVKMELASQGLPGETNPGFELLDGTNLGSTKDDREIKYKRALKGQLEKDLVNGIEAIEKATVHFETKSEDNIFLQEGEDESKATVVLGIKTGTKLKEDQINGIQHLIAAAITGLKTENVVVVNNEGTILSGKDGETNGNNQTDIVYQIENRIKGDIMKSLSSVFGYESVEVTVRAEINFDEIVRNIEKYDPKGTLVSKQEKKQNSESQDEQTLEVGTDANADVPEYGMENGKKGSYSTSSSEELIENFEVGKTVETIKKNPELTYLSVSVAVDQTMTEDEIKILEKHVAVAAGISDKDQDGLLDNGDVKVTPFVFKQQQEQATDIEEDVVKALDNTVLLISLVAGILLLLLIIIILILKRKKENRERVSQMEKQKLAEKEERDLLNKMKKEVEEDESDMDEETKRYRQDLSKEATDAAEDNPRRTAEYINKLINEG